MIIKTTLQELRDAGACGPGFRAILLHMGKPKADKTEVTLEDAIACGVEGSALLFYLLNGKAIDADYREILVDHLISIEPRLAQIETDEISFYVAKHNCIPDAQIRGLIGSLFPEG